MSKKPNKKVDTESVYLTEIRENIDKLSVDNRVIVLSNLMVAEEIHKFRMRLEE